MRAMTTHRFPPLPAVIAASFSQPDVPKLPVAGKVIHGLQPRNDHILTTTRSEISIANSKLCMRFVSTELGQEAFFFSSPPPWGCAGSAADLPMRDAPSKRAVTRSALLRFPFFIYFFKNIVNIAGGQREGLPVGVTGQRQGLKHHRSGECADERLAGG